VEIKRDGARTVGRQHIAVLATGQRSGRRLGSQRGASSTARAAGIARSGTGVVSPLSAIPSAAEVAEALLVSASVRATISSRSSSSPASTRTVPLDPRGWLSAPMTSRLALHLQRGAQLRGIEVKTIALPVGIAPTETTKRTGLVLARTPSHEATMPAASSDLGWAATRKQTEPSWCSANPHRRSAAGAGSGCSATAAGRRSPSAWNRARCGPGCAPWPGPPVA